MPITIHIGHTLSKSHPLNQVLFSGPKNDDLYGIFYSKSFIKLTFKFSDSLESTSNLTSVGSCNPALANSTNNFGNVAENRSVCLPSGNRVRISFSCSWNPISKRRSASSKTTYSTDVNLSSISTQTWTKRPGVAMMLQGSNVNKC